MLDDALANHASLDTYASSVARGTKQKAVREEKWQGITPSTTFTELTKHLPSVSPLELHNPKLSWLHYTI